MKNNISPDSMAILLLCSNIGMIYQKNKDNKYKPFTDKEWIKLSQRIIKSGLGRPSSLFNLSQKDLEEYLNIPSGTAERIKYLLSRSGSLILEIEKLSNMGIWVLTRADSVYPKKLKKTLKLQSPTILFGAGEIDILNTEGIGIVGSRDVDEKGAFFTDKLARKCARESLAVISGGSRGVDLIAQNAALEEGGKVVAVLSDSLSKTVQKKEILDNILKGNLLLLSAYHPNSRFSAYSALGRNKHIYGLSKYTVVSSSKAGKGGTWHGAIENLEAGWVPLFVRKEKEVPDGNIQLIEKGGIGLDPNELESAESLKVLLDQKVANHFKTNEKSDYYKTHLNVNQTMDLFYIAWPFIEKVLNKPRSKQELSDLFNVEPMQMDLWIKRAYLESKIKYVDETKVISTVFFNKDEYEDRQMNMFDLLSE